MMARKGKIRGIPLSALGKPALLQLQALGIDVSKQLAEVGRPRIVHRLESSVVARMHKYNISPKEQRTIDDITFDSKAEMSAYLLLKDRGVKYELQPRFTLQESFVDPLTQAKVRAVEYVADFLLRRADGVEFIVDIKGVETPEFKLKAKLMLARGLRVHRIKSNSQLLAFLIDNNLLSRSNV